MLFMLWPRWDISTTVFAISTWVFYWMEFLHPTGAKFSRALDVKVTNTELAGLLSAAVGSILAIAATLLPYPLLALSRSTEVAQELGDSLPRTWADFADYFCDAKPNLYKQDKLVEHLRMMQELSNTLEGHIAHSWWECFGLGQWQQIRITLTAFDKFSLRAFDMLSGTKTSCVALDWGPRHQEIMEALRPHVDCCITTSQTLLSQSLRAACDGDLDEAEEDQMKEAIKEVLQARSSLTLAFLKLKKQAQLPVVSEAELLEHVFCLAVCSFCTQVTNFAQELLQIDSLPPARELPGGLMAVFAPSSFLEKAHLLFVFKGMLAVLLGFTVGYCGSGVLGLSPYDASIACTASLLFSAAAGSAIVKNLQRVQGVVLGIVCGQLLHRMFISCAWYNSLVISGSLLLWTTINTFIYYNSASYATIGCLLAAFGAQKMLGGCHSASAGSDTDAHLLLVYSSIMTTVIAVALIMGIDVLLCQTRASDLTYTALLDAWHSILEALDHNFDPSVRETRYHKQEVLTKIVAAEGLGAEASLEPRLYRTAWPEATFNQTVKYLYSLRSNLANMEYGIAHEHDNGGRKTEVALQIEKIETFHRLPQLLVQKMRALEVLLGFFVHEKETPMPEFDTPEITKEYRKEEQAAKRAFLIGAVKVKAFYQDEPPSSLEDDPACEVSLILCSIDAMMLHLQNLQHMMNQNNY